MKPNLAYLNWVLNRLMVRQRPALDEVATRSWEVSPATSETSRPAIYLDDTLERISAYTPWGSEAHEMERVLGGPGEHAATVAYQMENVRISGPMLYRGAFKARHGFGPERPFADLPGHEAIDDAHLVSNFAGSLFFGSFLIDIAVEMLPGDGDHAIGMVTNEYGHEAEYRRMLSLPRPPTAENTTVGKLVFYSDFAQNGLKEERYRELRRRLRAHFPDAAERPAGVYLKRGVTGERRVVANETEIETVLAERGYDIVEPAVLSAEEITRRCLDAPVVVSVEGSHLSHAIYSLADDGAYVVLQPPDRFAMPYKEVADRLDQRFAFEVGTPAEGGFTIDVGRLQRLLDRLDA